MRRLFTTVCAFLFVAATARAQSDPALSARLDSALRALEAKGFSGVVRVDRNGATLLEKGYGLANRATQTRFSPQTVVQIGSNTKDFTAVAVLQLMNRGALTLRDSLGRFFPNAPADKRGITLLQLMNHVAGFPIGLGGDFDAVTRDELVANAMSRPLLFPPGTREQYSNTGFALLAAVIEQLSGKTYDQYVRDNILQPLGLTHTGFLLPAFDATLLAHGYRGAQDMGDILSKPHANDGPYWNLRGNGGILSTVDDMHAFYQALFESDKLLPPAVRALRFNADEPIGLAGSDLVNFFVYERLPRRGIEIVLATNTAEFRDRPVRAAIGDVLGLPSPGGGSPVASAPRANAKAPAPAVAAMLRDFIAVVNSGDAARIAKFVGEHFSIEPGAPGADARAQRFVQTHDNLGELRIVGLDQIDAATVEISATSANEGALTIKALISADGQMLGVQLMVGG